MPYIEVEAELDDFSTSDIVSEIIHRLQIRKTSRKALKDAERNELVDVVTELAEELGIRLNSEFQVSCLEDKLKVEHFMSVFQKYSIAQLEQLLP